MERSSTPSADSRLELLGARDERQRALDAWLGAGSTLVAVSLAIPGPTKAPPGAAALFEWGLHELRRVLPAARSRARGVDALGPFQLLDTPGAARTVKWRCMKVEAAAPGARLLDLDVYSPEGSPVDRASLCVPPRPCLCCGEPARDCIRAGRHAQEEVVARAMELLAPFRD